MDQDSFRKLLATAKTTPTTRPTSQPQYSQYYKRKIQTVPSSEPASDFKPRKLNTQPLENDSKYRDRAAERRTGTGASEFAQAEALLEDFEKRHANDQDNISADAERAYLGGDAEHTILVKGLDMALLEQNKAKLQDEGDVVVDDDTLEEAFQDAAASTASVTPSTTVGAKKKSRAELLKELKASRAGGSAASSSQPEGEVQNNLNSKFKPIGFKAIGTSADGAKKKKKKKKAEGEGDDGTRKKKKRKVDKGEPSSSTSKPHPSIVKPKPPKSHVEIDPDADIFADAGDYEGIELDSENEEDGGDAEPVVVDQPDSLHKTVAGWFNDEKPPEEEEVPKPPTPLRRSLSPSDDEEEDDGIMRLQPLSSSAMPDIKSILAMDNPPQRRRKGKSKKRGGKNDHKDNKGEADRGKKQKLKEYQS